jgi:hypothetical protein
MTTSLKPQLKVLTANRLSDGVAVWYGQTSIWVERVEDAYAVEAGDAAAKLEQVAAAALSSGHYCDVVVIDVENSVSGLRPVKLRERIRAQGPTVRRDLGKQAGCVSDAA